MASVVYFTSNILNSCDITDFIVPSIDATGNNIAMAGSASPGGRPAGAAGVCYLEFASPSLSSSMNYSQGNSGCIFFGGQETVFYVMACHRHTLLDFAARLSTAAYSVQS